MNFLLPLVLVLGQVEAPAVSGPSEAPPATLVVLKAEVQETDTCLWLLLRDGKLVRDDTPYLYPLADNKSVIVTGAEGACTIMLVVNGTEKVYHELQFGEKKPDPPFPPPKPPEPGKRNILILYETAKKTPAMSDIFIKLRTDKDMEGHRVLIYDDDQVKDLDGVKPFLDKIKEDSIALPAVFITDTSDKLIYSGTLPAGLSEVKELIKANGG